MTSNFRSGIDETTQHTTYRMGASHPPVLSCIPHILSYQPRSSEGQDHLSLSGQQTLHSNSNVHPGELLEVVQPLVHTCKGQFQQKAKCTHSWGHLTLLPLIVWNFFSSTFFTGSSSLKVMKTKPRLLFDFGSIGSSMASICKHRQSSTSEPTENS